MSWKNHCCTLISASALLKLGANHLRPAGFPGTPGTVGAACGRCEYRWWFREGQSASLLPPRAGTVFQTPTSHLALQAAGWSSPPAGMRGCRLGEKPERCGAASQLGWSRQGLALQQPRGALPGEEQPVLGCVARHWGCKHPFVAPAWDPAAASSVFSVS